MSISWKSVCTLAFAMLLIPVSGRAQRATVDLVGTVRDGTHRA